ncbi:Retinoblastoma-associated protein, B-box,Retinoblastoma-associated protein, A-box,Cyclin- [Cinara cedri]|uniref:Retinoblastoma-associated protein, B-box,Retinoblastoma-associated protein, A-box,Cyclin n=1 Tax=Cinara cedri TaxID=506608 RepID=A0A5E4MEY2_9HEMI|nr:Retinoblastoma-associated protein, B-box,Retinoblastoma-associated protein, A-box,Cyclin- [Cinara cedri]
MGVPVGTVHDEDVYNGKYLELCKGLNLDKNAANRAWETYQTVRENYSLDGDVSHWLACAIYVACRNVTEHTVGDTETLIEGNLVSLTRLLRLCNISLIHFIGKSKKWADMINMPTELRRKIDKLEKNFAVSMVIFKKFQPIFTAMFNNIKDDQSKFRFSKKQKVTCSAAKLFEFCWTLFVVAKSEFPNLGENLVNSYHLLLACCDYVYTNVLMADLRDLLNKSFGGLPQDFEKASYVPPSKPFCIIDYLCQHYDGITTDAKVIKEYFWKNNLKKLIEKKVLKGDPNLNLLLDVGNFDFNYKAINKRYEQYVLSVGEFDERIFLSDNANNEIGASNECTTDDLAKEMKNQKNNLFNQQTPLTGRNHLKPKIDISDESTPVKNASEMVFKIQSILTDCLPYPSDKLNTLLKSCSEMLKNEIDNLIKILGNKFCTQYCKVNSALNHDFAKKRLIMAKTWFYKLFENIIAKEAKNPKYDIKTLICHSVFHETLFACCLEMVMFAYNTERPFPWVLDALQIHPYHFYKVIEVIVRVEDKLPRDMVKHLNSVEEQVLDSLSWQSKSPLWDLIDKNHKVIPHYEDIALVTISGGAPTSNVNQMIENNRLTHKDSPVSDRFISPAPGQNAIKVVKPNSMNENRQYIPIAPKNNSASLPIVTGPLKKIGTLGLFFRKFYNLASVRMQDLCYQLSINDEDLIRKIWTCFEYVIIEHTNMMCDRHLDQILMCTIYIICRVVNWNLSFQNIMKCYRTQPQSASHIYRSVLISSRNSSQNHVQSEGQNSEQRIDLIKFYNTIFVQVVKDNALKYSTNSIDLTLSPLPAIKTQLQSPTTRRVNDRLPIYIRKLEAQVSPIKSPIKPLSYCINQSPKKDLENINMITMRTIPKKRNITDEHVNGPIAKQKTPSPPVIAKRLQGLLEERMEHNTDK